MRKMIYKAVCITTICLALVFALIPIGAEADSLPCDCLDTIHTRNLGHLDVNYEDNSPAVWVGGDFYVNSRFVESEGLLIVEGDMSVQNGELWLSIGVPGLGSGILPTSNGVMLAVGGYLVVSSPPTTVKIGEKFSPTRIIGAVALIGGKVEGDVIVVNEDGEENTDKLIDDLGVLATAQWADFQVELEAESSMLASLTANGSVIPAANAWDPIEFIGTATGTSLQVFDMSADTFATTAFGEFVFTDIPEFDNGRFAPIVINVYGENATFYQNFVHVNGNLVNSPNPFDSPDFGNAASAILWNFVDVKNLSVTGTSQVMGSIIAPYAESTSITAHTNGRLYVNGNLTRSGDGTEHHNYPWTGGEWWFTCSHEAVLGAPSVLGMPGGSDDAGGSNDTTNQGNSNGLSDPNDSNDPNDMDDSSSLTLDLAGESDISEDSSDSLPDGSVNMDAPSGHYDRNNPDYSDDLIQDNPNRAIDSNTPNDMDISSDQSEENLTNIDDLYIGTADMEDSNDSAGLPKTG